MAALNSPMLRSTSESVFFTPSPRRRAAVLLSCHNKKDSPQVILRDNDDAAERRRKRLSKATSNTLSPATPRTASRLDSERSNVQKKTGLTDLQIKEVYSNCIKLSSENKINSKNAFCLHLIDYMEDLIKTLREGEMTNFQVASCTLDASAKIYAGRVDSIHAQAYKMLGGLGRADENAEQENRDNGESQTAARAKMKATNHKQGNTIEKNLKNINVNQFDLEFEVDPLFQKTSAAFDEGGTSGLLLNHLCMRDDSCELLLDSSIALTSRNAATSSQTTQDSSMVDLSEFQGMFSRVDFDVAVICPHFSDFEFTNWSNDGEANAADGTNEHAFDMDAPASETACQYADHAGDDYSDDDIPDMGGNMEFGGDRCYQQEPSAIHTINDTGLTFANGPTTGVMSLQAMGDQAVDSVAAALGNLCLELSEQPSEYSYYKSTCTHLTTWAGPDHWKRRNAFPKGPATTSTAGDLQAKKKRGKKHVVKVDFDSELNFTELNKRGKASNTLSKASLQKLSVFSTTLPEDCPCSFAGYDRFFIKKKMMVKRLLQARASSADGDEGSEWYNYNNADDCANFCPRLQDRDDDDDDDVGAPADNMAGSDTSGGFACQDMTCDLSQGASFGYESIMDQTMFTGDGLVAQPNKVQKIDINYAKTAKKMDVKKLKTAIWDILTVDEQENKENLPNEQSKSDKTPTSFTTPKSFQDLYRQLPDKVSKHMAKNLSVPIAFVCILHLANEKCLKLVGNSTMSDFTITQGL